MFHFNAFRLAVCVAFCLLGTNAAHANLESRLGGQAAYDTDRNITWLTDANYAQTTGYSATGMMNWAAANTWAGNLSISGISGWRLPSSVNCLSYNCTDSEMGHLFYIELGGLAGSDIRQTRNSDFDLFQDIQGGYYWSVTPHPSDVGNAFDFNFEGGLQSSDDENFPRFAWAVRDGDIAAIPEPETYAMLLGGLGLLGFAVRRRTQQAA